MEGIMKFKILLACAVSCLSFQAHAAETFTATNYYVTSTEALPIDKKSGHWSLTFDGISEVSAGPVDTMAVTCRGSGFWSAKGVSGQGYCVHGSGDDTFTLRWEAVAGASENRWQVLAGTGKYSTLKGQGIAKTQKLAGNRRITTLQGEVTLDE